jgi:DNA-directed RNA polymerase subunit M/transcription elongation factor TFIIS
VTSVLEQLRDNNKGICRICEQEGILASVERLPGSGILKKAIHKNNVEHRWVVYESILDIGARPRKEYKPSKINCPVCGQQGNIYDHVPDKRKPENVKYFVHHGVVKGSRTPEHYNGKQIVCYIKEQAHRDIILKKLGRYIEPQPQSQYTYSLISNTLQNGETYNNLEGDLSETDTKEEKFRTGTKQLRQIQSVQQARNKDKIIECPKCHQNGVLNVAKRDQDPEKTTFYVRHEKLSSTWGRDHKVDRIKRCYIGRLNLQHPKSLGESQTEDTQEKSKLKGRGLDRYIEPEVKAHPTIARKIPGKKSNPNIECPDCGRLGTLRPFGGVRYYVAHGSDPRNRCYIKSSNVEQIAYCREKYRKHREELITKSSKVHPVRERADVSPADKDKNCNLYRMKLR